MRETLKDDLEALGTWDYDKAEKRPPAKRTRVVVLVAFSCIDFDQVAERAESLGMKTSEFIRVATLDRAKRHAEVTSFSWSGGSAGTFVVEKPFEPSTLVAVKVHLDEMEPPTI